MDSERTELEWTDVEWRVLPEQRIDMRHPTRDCLLAFALLIGSACDARNAEPLEPSVKPAADAQRVEADSPVVPVDPATFATTLLEIPALEYRPLFRGEDEPSVVAVDAFLLEEHAVTNAQYAAFVRAVPAWRRSRAKKLFVDDTYLSHWQSDVEPGSKILESPVTNVSWFAARAYARFIGRRLPTLNEWEAVASSSERLADARQDPAFVQRILAWYGRPTPSVLPPVRSTFANIHGVYDMHALVWEWVDDFSTALVTGESRGDTGLERNLFCGAGSVGTADPRDYAAFMRYAFRSSLNGRYAVKNLGFRCASSKPPVSDGAHAKEEKQAR